MLRLYWPNEKDPTILNGSWKPPAVKVAKSTPPGVMQRCSGRRGAAPSELP